jgi:hypothetical protein
MRSIRIEAADISLLPVVKGLVSEEGAVSRSFDEVRPDVIAISVSREDLEGLHRREDYEKYEPSDLEIIYQAFLESFGEVRIPPPAYVRALEISEERGTPIIPIDMNEELYTETYCQNVRTRDMIRESFFARRATGKTYDLSSPEAFARSWDARVNRARGFRELERAREAHMANALRRLSGKYSKILAVIECERLEGVARTLEDGSAANQDTLIK